MTKTRFIVVLVIGFTLFVFLAPVVPLNTSNMFAATIRVECFGAGATSPVTIYSSITFFLFYNFGTVFLPKGVPYNSDGNALFFEPFGPNRTIQCS